MTNKKPTLEDIADKLDCIARAVTMVLQQQAKDREEKKRSKIYLERGYRA